jgi:NTE family protein
MASSKKAASSKTINLALQGGGAHGAFTWGVIDRLLEDGRINIEGISGSSAGALNAVVLAYGLIKGPENARRTLHEFWEKISYAGQIFNPVRKLPWEQFFFGQKMEYATSNHLFQAFTHMFSPYMANPLNFNPLKDILVSTVDFDVLEKSGNIKLWLTATNVNTGKGRVFSGKELSADVVMASACIPHLFQAVEIDECFYWDGGFMGNPVLYPLIYDTTSSDILIVHINPIFREGLPMTSHDIMNRMNEISFNTALIKELRAVTFVQDLISKKWIKEEYLDQMKNVFMHSVFADEAMSDISAASKLSSDWEFLTMMRDRGRDAADSWLKQHYVDVNKRSSVDLKKEFF